MSGHVDMFRCIPTSRLKAFVEKYIEEHYETAEGNKGKLQFSYDSGIPYRRVYGILREEHPNFSFDFVDRMLTNLDCVFMWHQPKEAGGFADYYECDEPPAPAVATESQAIILAEAVLRKREHRRKVQHLNPDAVS